MIECELRAEDKRTEKEMQRGERGGEMKPAQKRGRRKGSNKEKECRCRKGNEEVIACV